MNVIKIGTMLRQLTCFTNSKNRYTCHQIGTLSRRYTFSYNGTTCMYVNRYTFSYNMMYVIIMIKL